MNREAFRSTLLLLIPFWLGYIAGKGNSFVITVAAIVLASVLIDLIEGDE